MQLAFVGSEAQTQISKHDLYLTELQAFKSEQRRIEGRMAAQNDHLRKRQANHLRKLDHA